MRCLRFAALLGICLFCASFASAQRVIVGVGVGPAYVGPAPVCAYGYYDYYPYACAPYGYYGPEWFVDGVFIGAGPWYHGYYWHRGFYGRGYYGRGYYGGRDFGRRGWDHDGFRGRGFDHAMVEVSSTATVAGFMVAAAAGMGGTDNLRELGI